MTKLERMVPYFLALLVLVFSLHFMLPRGLITIELVGLNQGEYKLNEIGYQMYPWSSVAWVDAPSQDNLAEKSSRVFARIPGGWHAETIRIRAQLSQDSKGIEQIWLRSPLGAYQIDFGKKETFSASEGEETLKIYSGSLSSGRLVFEDGSLEFEIQNLWALLFKHSIKPYSTGFYCLLFSLFALHFSRRILRGKSSKALAPLVILWAAFLQLRSDPIAMDLISPTDLISKLPAFELYSQGVIDEHPEHTDSIDSHLPKWISMKEAVWKGKVPTILWNRAGGEAGIWSPINETYGPFFWTFAIIPSNALGFYLAILLKLFLLGSGFYFFARTFIGRVGAIFGATTFMFCGFNVAWLFVPAASSFVWLAWVLGFLARVAHTKKTRHFIGLVLSLSLLICGGFPMIAVFGSVAISILILSLIITRNIALTNAKLLAVFCGACVLCLLISAFPLSNLWIQLSQVDLEHRAKAGSDFVFQDLFSFFPFFEKLARDTKKETLINSGFLGTLGAVFLLPWLMYKHRSIPRNVFCFGVFSLAIFLTTFLIIFNLVPKEIMWKLPFFASNPWGRMASIAGLAISGALAFFIDQFYLKMRLRFGIAASFVLFSLIYTYNQTDLRKQFRNINSTAPGSLFYPRLQVINFLSLNSTSLDSVFSDNSFGISGFLAAYGLSEWCAHGFMSNPLKQVIDATASNAFASRTSCNIKTSDVNFSDRSFDLLATKHLVLNQRVLDRDLVGKQKLADAKKWRRAFSDGDTTVYENKDYLGAGLISKGGSEVGELSPLKLESDWALSGGSLSADLDLTLLQESDWVVLPIHFQPHLLATWNNKSIELKSFHGAFPMFSASGRGKLQLHYSPTSWKWTILTSLFGIIALGLVGIYFRKR